MLGVRLVLIQMYYFWDKKKQFWVMIKARSPIVLVSNARVLNVRSGGLYCISAPYDRLDLGRNGGTGTVIPKI